MGAAIFSNFVGMLEIPVDLSSNSKSIVITSAFVVDVIVKFTLTLFLKYDIGGLKHLGMVLSVLGPTFTKKLLKVSEISLGSSMIKLLDFSWVTLVDKLFCCVH